MTETTTGPTTTPTTGEMPAAPPGADASRSAPMAKPDIEMLQQKVVETFFGIVGAPDDPESLEAGARILRELDVALESESTDHR